jgi:hypothetical protein
MPLRWAYLSLRMNFGERRRTSRRRTPAPLRHGYAGVRLDQNPDPLLHKTRLRKWGPVTIRPSA